MKVSGGNFHLSFVLSHLLFVLLTFYQVNLVKIRALPNQEKCTIAPPAFRRSGGTSLQTLLTTILIQQTLLK
ncbi:hypothetical protein [Coleofasciculus sp.]|uniref:hypothetical protein n=1 Tax=Coleofasciculus sp. TaxID=3100458 RepID=UPI003A33AFEF